MPVKLTGTQAKALKHQPDTPQGRRDAVLMCLLLDHGLRCGEVAGLRVEHINLHAGTFTFYLEKVDLEQTHKLTADTFRALYAYLTLDAPVGALLMGSRKDGKLEGRMSVRAINKRVGMLGKATGVVNLSPHDCRHYWTTAAIRGGSDVKSVQEGGGWKSPLLRGRRGLLGLCKSGAAVGNGIKIIGRRGVTCRPAPPFEITGRSQTGHAYTSC